MDCRCSPFSLHPVPLLTIPQPFAAALHGDQTGASLEESQNAVDGVATQLPLLFVTRAIQDRERKAWRSLALATLMAPAVKERGH